MDICGIDEAGRGPIAGPLIVAGCILLKDIEDLKDSKKLSPKKRELLYELIIQNSKYHIEWCSNEEIDKFGISFCMKRSLENIKKNLPAKEYLFDGNSNFKVENIKTIIKGDSKIKQISAASIIAKVTRDRFMIEIAPRYKNFNFAKHKGYITKEHIQEIKKYGYTSIHRKSFKVKSLS